MTTIAIEYDTGIMYSDTMASGSNKYQTSTIKLTGYVGKNVTLGVGAHLSGMLIGALAVSGTSSVEKREVMRRFKDTSLVDALPDIGKSRLGSGCSADLIAAGYIDDELQVIHIQMNSQHIFDAKIARQEAYGSSFALGCGSDALDVLTSRCDIPVEYGMAMMVDLGIDADTGGYLTSMDVNTGVLNIYTTDATKELAKLGADMMNKLFEVQ